MTKHKHNWQFVDISTYMPRGDRIAEFICECGETKRVEVK